LDCPSVPCLRIRSKYKSLFLNDKKNGSVICLNIIFLDNNYDIDYMPITVRNNYSKHDYMPITVGHNCVNTDYMLITVGHNRVDTDYMLITVAHNTAKL
jgi:hypothetical protein